MKTTLGDRIRELRTSHGLTQKEFSDMLRLSRVHITNIEKGKDYPSKSVVRLISVLFKVKEDWLFNGEEVNPFDINNG